jgi:hypothetical protein
MISTHTLINYLPSSMGFCVSSLLLADGTDAVCVGLSIPWYNINSSDPSYYEYITCILIHQDI